jgi:phosphatidylserine/phosphatidylglycerophosphate/cardiolipin synthase-like enzyme
MSRLSRARVAVLVVVSKAVPRCMTGAVAERHSLGPKISGFDHDDPFLGKDVLEDYLKERWTVELSNSLSTNVRYTHTRYMLVDPLGDDPIVISGSANFSDASTTNNDENMLVIRPLHHGFSERRYNAPCAAGLIPIQLDSGAGHCAESGTRELKRMQKIETVTGRSGGLVMPGANLQLVRSRSHSLLCGSL